MLALRFELMDKKIKSEQISDEEILIFRQAIKHVKPLKHDKIFLRKKPKTPVKRHLQEEDIQDFQLSDHQTENTVSSKDKLFFTRPGLPSKLIQKLKRGKIPITATLDLHGYSSESARDALTRFIQLCYRDNKKCVIIIHGKGDVDKPILKNKVNNWLRQIDKVLGFCTAIPQHGGNGAVYVLLKSSHK